MTDESPADVVWLPGKTSPCRSCGARIVWCVVRASGRRMPVNPKPEPDGNVVNVGSEVGDRSTLVRVLALGEHTDKVRYRSHFETCPAASEHRVDRRPGPGVPASVFVCSKCSRPLSTIEARYERIDAWVRARGQGGSSTPRLRTDVGEVACAACIDAAERGANPDQGTLL
jgi:hypothetical protein